jgi:formylglycine-generating enzyme required for sulfatase activity
MSGNVWEWVEDWYHSNYTGAPTDGSAWVDTGDGRVIRGGSFLIVASFLRSSNRYTGTPDYRYAYFGARCLRPIP